MRMRCIYINIFYNTYDFVVIYVSCASQMHSTGTNTILYHTQRRHPALATAIETADMPLAHAHCAHKQTHGSTKQAPPEHEINRLEKNKCFCISHKFFHTHACKQMV